MKKQNAYRSNSVLWEMIVSLRMQNAECKMQNEGIPSGDKIKRSDKERLLQAIKKSIRVCLLVYSSRRDTIILHLAFCILHSLCAKRSFFTALIHELLRTFVFEIKTIFPFHS